MAHQFTNVEEELEKFPHKEKWLIPGVPFKPVRIPGTDKYHEAEDDDEESSDDEDEEMDMDSPASPTGNLCKPEANGENMAEPGWITVRSSRRKH